jgi:hypothetical protein
MPVVASLDDIEALIEKNVPPRLYAIDENKDACVPAKQARVCLVPRLFASGCAVAETVTDISPQIDCHISGAVDRGRITIGGTGRVATVTMPVSASATISGRGEIGRNIRTTATGSITAKATVEADLDKNWNPVAKADADYSWDNLIGINVLGFRITFANNVDPKIRELIDSFRAKLPELLGKLKVREQAAKAWSQGFGSVQVSKGPDVWLRFSPTAVGFSGFWIDGRSLRADVMAAGTTETFLGERPPDPPKEEPLPPLTHALPDPSFSFYVPIYGDYTTLVEAARKALKVGEEQTLEVPHVGAVKVIFRDVYIHQTIGMKLAIGVKVDAKSSSDFFRTKGVVWTIATFDIDNERHRVKLHDFDIFSRTDNPPLDLLVSILKLGPINRGVRQAVEYDYSKEYENAVNAANNLLTRQISDEFNLKGVISSLSAEKVEAGPKALIVLASAKGSVAMRYRGPTR